MGGLLERLREVETLEEASSLVDEAAKDITPDDVIEAGSPSDQLLPSDPTRAQIFAEIAARASERIGSWELRLRSQISKANALIARG